MKPFLWLALFAGLLSASGASLPRWRPDGGLADCESCAGSDDGFAHDGLLLKLGLGSGLSHPDLGAVVLRMPVPGELICKPDALELEGDAAQPAAHLADELSIRRDGFDRLRQLATPRLFINIVTNGPWAYSIDVYRKAAQGSMMSNGFFAVLGGTNVPIIRFKVHDPHSGTNGNKAIVIQAINGATNEWHHEFSAVLNGWSTILPGGHGSILNLQTNHASNAWTQVSRRINGLGQLVEEKCICFTNLSWGRVAYQSMRGTNGESRVRTMSYYTDTNALPFLPSTGRPAVKTTQDHDGSWSLVAAYDSGGRKLTVLHGIDCDPTTNTALCRRTEYSYQPQDASDHGWREPDSPRLVLEYYKDVLVRKTFHVFSTNSHRIIKCANPNALLSDAGNEVTETVYEPGTMSVLRRHHPDGTASTEWVLDGADGTVTNRVESGEWSAPANSIVRGVRTETVESPSGVVLSERAWSIDGGILGVHLASKLFSDFDEDGRPRRISYLDGTHEAMTYACCGLEALTDRDGVVETYGYDELGRRISTTRLGITDLQTLDAAGRVLSEIRIGSDGSTVTKVGRAFDTSGMLVRETNALGGVTVWSETCGVQGMERTTTLPDGGTRLELRDREGRLIKVTGTASAPVRYEYGVEQDGGIWREYAKEIRLTAGGADTAEWTKTFTDGLGRAYKTLFSAVSTPYPMRQSFYNNKGQRWKESDPDGVTALYQYNAEGDLEYTASDLDQDGVLDLAGPDRVTRVVRDVTTYSGSNVHRTRTYRLGAASAATETLVRTDYASTDGLKRWTLVAGQNSHALSETVYGGGGTRTVTTTQPDGSKVEQIYTNGRLTRTTRKNSANGQVERVDYAYDAHGRLWKATDARNGDTAYAYNAADQVTAVTTPAPGTGQAAQTTVSYYDTLGRLKGTLLPDGATTTNFHFVTGLLQKTSGSRQYPVEYTYDAQGRMKTMKTWQDHAGNAGTAVTTWNYDPHRGWLASKDYPDATTGAAGTVGPDYAYTAGGRLKTRTWARNHSGGSRIVTTYKYGFDDAVANNQHGDLTDVSYNDGTAGHTHTHDRRGRLATTVRGGITTTHTWNDADLSLGEAHAGGSLNTLAVERAYFGAADAHALKLQTLSVKKGAVVQRSATHAWDTAGRLSGVTADSGASATYAYLPNSPLWQTLTFKQGATTRLTTTRGFDRLNRLQTISSSPSASGAQPVGVGYLYNDANQRVRATDADGSHWVYEYDALGQVKGGKKYWSDGTPVAGQQFTYVHDDIGNRTATGAGGNEAGTGLRASAYTRNRLNQYTARTVPSAVDVLGVAASGGTVTVNSQAAYRRGEYFRQELAVANAAAPVATAVTVSAGGAPTAGTLVTPPAGQAFVHDLDGNLTDDGVWTYTWDAENRLAGMQHKATLADTAARRKLAFEYDARGRRIRRQVFPWGSTDYGATATSDQRFVYDGWNLLAIFDPQFSILQSFVWGLDLSGTAQGAGGVGGLLAAITGTTAQFAAFDGNGNVRALADGTSGAWSAQYEYGPFGELIRATGPQAKANPFRFSTKWHDDESDLLYYGYRYYQPGTGRWLGRDPIEEEGGVNLYCFVYNDAFGRWDYLGLADKTNWGDASASRKWRYERFSIILTLPCETDDHRQILYQMYVDMRDFVHYAPNLARLSFASSVNGLPGRKAVFDMEWVPDFGRIEVQMVPNRGQRMVRAMTLNWHPLVGVRRWGLHQIGDNPVQIEFFTDAWEMPSSWYDDWSMIFFQQSQHDMWVRYLENYGNAWNGRMGVSWRFPNVNVTPAWSLPGNQGNPFRNELPAPLQ
jgi:RHS repeat-associated protein